LYLLLFSGKRAGYLPDQNVDIIMGCLLSVGEKSYKIKLMEGFEVQKPTLTCTIRH